MANWMTIDPLTILLVEDNQDYAWMLQFVLAEIETRTYHLIHVASLDAAIQCMRDDDQVIDVLLLDLSLPDSQGFETYRIMHSIANDKPIIVMTAQDDKLLALRAVREGAQDFLIKGETDITQLLRAIDYAVERHLNTIELKRLSFIDDLTGLLNRRGFLNMAEQQIKIADRANREMLLFFADMDGLKQINDTRGHQFGDQALRSIASILEDTFRSSDLIARLGGDEFTILAIDAPKQNAEQILTRLQNNIDRHNLNNQNYQLSLSIGVARFRPNQNIDLDKMLVQADGELYQHKRVKHNSTSSTTTA
ncbi:MAG TPA: GGDEF domain-containing response regulator [Anaerolineales bacterium]|nr:GGDEF domain-containing response regulator [Anaerolineales bacterium]